MIFESECKIFVLLQAIHKRQFVLEKNETDIEFFEEELTWEQRHGYLTMIEARLERIAQIGMLSIRMSVEKILYFLEEELEKSKAELKQFEKKSDHEKEKLCRLKDSSLETKRNC